MSETKKSGLDYRVVDERVDGLLFDLVPDFHRGWCGDMNCKVCQLTDALSAATAATSYTTALKAALGTDELPDVENLVKYRTIAWHLVERCMRKHNVKEPCSHDDYHKGCPHCEAWKDVVEIASVDTHYSRLVAAKGE